MKQGHTKQENGLDPEQARWGAVFALTLCVATLIASEFMPVSLLTPIASDLAMSEGAVGQAIAVSGLYPVVTSLSISTFIRGVDRRVVLLCLTMMMLISGVMVAFAPSALWRKLLYFAQGVVVMISFDLASFDLPTFDTVARPRATAAAKRPAAMVASACASCRSRSLRPPRWLPCNPNWRCSGRSFRRSRTRRL